MFKIMDFHIWVHHFFLYFFFPVLFDCCHLEVIIVADAATNVVIARIRVYFAVSFAASADILLFSVLFSI